MATLHGNAAGNGGHSQGDTGTAPVLDPTFRGGDGDVGIIRSPVRAIALPDCPHQAGRVGLFQPCIDDFRAQREDLRGDSLDFCAKGRIPFAIQRDVRLLQISDALVPAGVEREEAGRRQRGQLRVGEDEVMTALVAQQGNESRVLAELLVFVKTPVARRFPVEGERFDQLHERERLGAVRVHRLFNVLPDLET
jgi:hypothetical protein